MLDNKKLDNLQKIENDLIDEIKSKKSLVFEQYKVISEINESIMESYARVKENENKLLKKIAIKQNELNKIKKELAVMRKSFSEIDSQQMKSTFEFVHTMQTELFVLEEESRSYEASRTKLQQEVDQAEKELHYVESLQKKLSVITNFMQLDQTSYEAYHEEVNQLPMGLKILEAQESEKKRVAREIHDGPAQMLANIMMQYEFIEQSFLKGDTKSALAEVKDLRENIQFALAEIRHIIFDLRPMSLDDLGIQPTIKKHVLTVEKQSGIPICLTIKGFDKRLKSHYEVAIFRLVQEALQNAVSHANASTIHVSLEMLNKNVNIIIKDNGDGFDVKNIKKCSQSYGLMGMKERVDLLKGKIAIQTQDNVGTTIKIRIPI